MAEFPLPGLQCPPGKEMTEFEGHVFVRQLGVGQYGVAKLFRNVATGETVAVKVRAAAVRCGLTQLEWTVSAAPDIWVGLRQFAKGAKELQGAALAYGASSRLLACPLCLANRCPRCVRLPCPVPPPAPSRTTPCPTVSGARRAHRVAAGSSGAGDLQPPRAEPAPLGRQIPQGECWAAGASRVGLLGRRV